MMGVLATCLFYGDAMITPAISVLSAVEGLTVVEAGMQPLVIPISIAILVGLFLVQSRGTAKVGILFGPVILIYMVLFSALFATYATLVRATDGGPATSELFHRGLVAVETMALLLSSFVCGLAMITAKRSNMRAAASWGSTTRYDVNSVGMP